MHDYGGVPSTVDRAHANMQIHWTLGWILLGSFTRSLLSLSHTLFPVDILSTVN